MKWMPWNHAHTLHSSVLLSSFPSLLCCPISLLFIRRLPRLQHVGVQLPSLSSSPGSPPLSLFQINKNTYIKIHCCQNRIAKGIYCKIKGSAQLQMFSLCHFLLQYEAVFSKKTLYLYTKLYTTYLSSNNRQNLRLSRGHTGVFSNIINTPVHLANKTKYLDTCTRSWWRLKQS